MTPVNGTGRKPGMAGVCMLQDSHRPRDSSGHPVRCLTRAAMAATPRHCGRILSAEAAAGSQGQCRMLEVYRDRRIAWAGSVAGAEVTERGPPIVAPSLPRTEAVVSRSPPHAPRLPTLTDEYVTGASRLHTRGRTAAFAFLPPGFDQPAAAATRSASRLSAFPVVRESAWAHAPCTRRSPDSAPAASAPPSPPSGRSTPATPARPPIPSASCFRSTPPPTG